MSEITVKDFEGLNLPRFTAKLQGVHDLDFLTSLEQLEKDGENRKGAIAAINERQGVLVDQVEKVEDGLKADQIVTDENLGTEEPPIEGWDDEDDTDIIKEVNEQTKDLDKTLGEQTPPVKETVIVQDGVEITFTEGANQKLVAPPENTSEDAIADVKATRLEIDKVLQFAEAHFGVSKDCEKPLFLAKAWLDKLLYDLGDNSPYDVEVKTAKDIPATAEKNEGTEFLVKRRQFSNLNSLDAVLELRESMGWIIDRIKNSTIDVPVTREGAIARTNAYTHACEAKFFLGTDLARLRG